MRRKKITHGDAAEPRYEKTSMAAHDDMATTPVVGDDSSPPLLATTPVVGVSRLNGYRDAGMPHGIPNPIFN
jgi:hypothetical protein